MRLEQENPELYDRLCTIFEDEALNSDLSPTLLSAYLKRRLGYGDKAESAASAADCGQMKLVFDHDILEDGS